MDLDFGISRPGLVRGFVVAAPFKGSITGICKGSAERGTSHDLRLALTLEPSVDSAACIGPGWIRSVVDRIVASLIRLGDAPKCLVG